jgi:hypothetical protein
MTQSPDTIDLTPSWEFAVRIYITVLENPEASAEARRSATDELLRLARMVDEFHTQQKANT